MSTGHRRETATVWAGCVGLGVRTLRTDPLLGLKRLVLPVSYWRTAEFSFVWARLRSRAPLRVLDVGSPKQLPVLLARSLGCEVVSVDVLDTEVATARSYAASLGIEGRGAGRLHAEVQDGRALQYPDASFDVACSVSVLEHIPGHGDSDTVRELARVVRPGGTLILTVPYDRHARETWVDGDVYERKQVGGEPVFFQRHYDEATLHERLVQPSGARLRDLEIWGERRIRAEAAMARLGRWGDALSPLQPLLALLFLRRIEPGQLGNPMSAFLTLETAAD